MPATLSPTDRDDIRQMIAHALPGVPTLLDFSNDMHYRFYLKQLELAGIDRQTYPEQFAVLAQSRQEHQLNGAPTAGDGYDFQPIQAISALGTDDDVAYDSSAFSSVPNQPYVSQMTLGMYDLNGNPIGTAQFAQQYNAGTDLTVMTAGTAPPATPVVTALSSYMWQDQNGNAYHGYLHASTSQAPTNITNIAPMPDASKGQTVTKLCLGRTGADCTYMPAGGSGSNVLMPVAGSITFSSDISTNPPTPNTCLITMARPDTGQGGGCTIKSTSNFFGDPNTIINGNNITWNLDPAQFQPANGCLTPNSEAIYTFTISLTVNVQPILLPVYVTITSGTVPPSNPYYLQIPKLLVFFSCIAEGTEITLHNGTTRPIERCGPGDRVLADAAGTVLTVDGMLKGTEEVPMVRIQTTLGHNLLVTGGHPMVTPEGVTLARMLKPGDRLVSLDGDATVSAITMEMYSGHVWNMNVGDRVEDFNAIPDTRTFFAGGLLVGDNQMQFKHNRIHRYIPESVRSALPSRWQTDFENHLRQRRHSTPI
ncbi:MAG TPA: Hint domain-containing protein [Candidatus Kapabacteria bacterium]|nr:Hint domain-containing protein [Candidatus Kapabacteria bacterium]